MASRKRKLRNKKFENDRRDDGKFSKRCGCIMHSTWSEQSLFEVFNLKTSKKFSMKIISEMKASMLLPKYGTLICTACYDKYKERDEDVLDIVYDEEETR